MVQKLTRFSFNGYNLWEWFKGNWTTVKEVLKVGAPLILTLSFIKDSPAMVGFLTIVGKFLLDGLDYWVKAK